MEQRHDEAYVLGTQQLGEADLIVTLFAENHGQVRAVARSGRRSRRRFGGRLEPLTHVRATWSEREGRELHRLDAVEELRSFAVLQTDPLHQATCAVFAEVARAFAHEGQGDCKGFRLLGVVLDALDRGGDPWLLVRYFEFWTLRLHGLLPDLERCAQCGRETGRSARVAVGEGLLCRECRPTRGGKLRPIGREERALLEALRRLAPMELPGGAAAAREGGVLELLLRGTLEAFAERSFRTYRHLRAVAAPPQAGGEQ